MICRLCLKDNSNTDLIKIFEKIGIKLKMSAVINKFFWFEPKVDDPISTAVCKICWQKVTDFNDFYAEVEEAHRLLTERFFFNKADNNFAKKVTQKQTIFLKQETGNNVQKLQTQNSQEELQLEELLENESIETIELQYNFVDDYDNDDDDNDNNDVEEVIESVEKKSEDNIGINLIKELEIDLNTELFKLDDSNENADTKGTNCSRITRSKTKNSQDATSNIKEQNYTKTQISKDNKQQKNLPNEKQTKETIKKKNNCIRTRKKILNDSTTTNRSSSRTENNSTDYVVVVEGKQNTNNSNVDEKIANYLRLFCEICNYKMDTFSELRKHMEQNHQQRGYATCCGKKFFKRVLLADHIEKHLNPNCYKCVDCDKVFADRQCMRNHFLIKHQPDENKTFQCKNCPKKFAKPYLLKLHKVIHEDRRYMCNRCDKSFVTIGHLSAHNKTVHANYGKMCDICAKVLRTKTAFENHMLEHQGIVAPKVQCDKCGSWHKDKYSLQKHKRRHNEEGISHVCNICGKSAPNRSAMLSHQRYVHESQRVFSCSLCKKSFKKSINLKEHMATHTGEVLYNCPHCTKTFISNANMHSHRKKAHPQEFEETRKRRSENRANTITTETRTSPMTTTTNTTKAKTANDAIQTTKAKITQIEKTADGGEVITINTYSDNGKPQSLILKATDFDAPDDDDDDEEGNSIIFTVQ